MNHKALGSTAPQPYKPPHINTGYRPGKLILQSREVRELLPPLMLQDYFKITNSGKYHLHFEMCVFKPEVEDINKEELIYFPPVDVEIEIELNPR